MIKPDTSSMVGMRYREHAPRDGGYTIFYMASFRLRFLS